MKIKDHYPDRKSLAQIEAPYAQALEIINTLYMEPPSDGLKCLSSTDVIDYYLMSCIRTIAEELTEGAVSFPSIYIKCKEQTYRNASCDNMFFDNFFVNADYEQTVIFGAVYYVLSCQKIVSQKYLDYIEKTFASDDRLMAYFQPFKNAVETLKEKEHRSIKPTKNKDIVEENLNANDGKRIILANRRNSDFTRIIQAMIRDQYFLHADKSAVTATEVGEMMLKLVGVNTEWKSMLQKAFSRDNPLKTFDKLRDAAQDYWTNRAHIDD